MSEHLLEPVRTIQVAGKDFTLKGTLGALKDIQHAFNDDIFNVQMRVLRLRFDELALLFYHGIKGSGEQPPSVEEIERAIIEDMGINEAQFAALEWLVRSISPKAEREKKVRATLDLIEQSRKLASQKPRKKADSPGSATDASA